MVNIPFVSGKTETAIKLAGKAFLLSRPLIGTTYAAWLLYDNAFAKDLEKLTGLDLPGGDKDGEPVIPLTPEMRERLLYLIPGMTALGIFYLLQNPSVIESIVKASGEAVPESVI